jgi:uncharacterized protein (UPF0218 family)
VAATRSGSNEPPRHLRLRPDLREELARPLGPVLTGEAAEGAIRKAGRLASCGDVVTQDALRWGARPFVAVVDGRTQRGAPRPVPAATQRAFPRVASARNPPGEITVELQDGLRALVDAGGGLLLVDGEEDLALLPLVEVLPDRTTVIYGQPGAGVAFVEVDRSSRARARALMDRMEVLA